MALGNRSASELPEPTLAEVPYGPHERQVLDFWKAKSDRPTPLVLFIHGGGWVGGNRQVENLDEYLAAGISVVSIEYRSIRDAIEAGVKPPVKWPMRDAARALQFVRSKAAEWNIDPARIGATGPSAGGCSCLWLAFHDDLAEPNSDDPVARQSTRLLCAAANRAQTTLDPKQMREWTPNSRYGGHAFGFYPDPKDTRTRDTQFATFLASRQEFLPLIREYSPYEHVTPDDPPIYLFYPNPPALGRDEKDPNHTANFGVKLQERLREVGVECKLVYPGAPDVRHPTIHDYLIDKLTSPRVSSAAPRPLNTFAGLELFLDDELISWTQNIARRVRPASKHPDNPIVRPEHPWESLYLSIHGTVMRDPATRRFRMWYNAIGPEYRKQRYLAYAESDDGHRWQKPMFDILPFGDHARTNLLLGRDFNVVGPCVLVNPKAPPNERYLVIFDSYTRYRPNSPESKLEARAVYVATSPDGIHFNPEKGRMIVLGKSDIGQSAVWNPDRGRIQLYLRGVNEYADENGLSQRVRYVRYAESDDGRAWSEPIELIKTDDLDGAPDTQVHQLTVTRYGNVYVGLLTLFRIERLELNGQHMGETVERLEHGVTETQLAFSRDGLRWTRVANRETFLPRGSPGQWDAGWIVTSSELVVADDEVWIYYAGFPHRYSTSQTAIGIATLPLDRFASLKPKRLNAHAVLELKPLQFRPGEELVINADAGKGGQIRSEVLDFNGRVIEGFAQSDSLPIRTDALRHALCWTDSNGRQNTLAHALARAPSHRALRLRFYLHNAEIFSVRSSSNHLSGVN